MRSCLDLKEGDKITLEDGKEYTFVRHHLSGYACVLKGPSGCILYRYFMGGVLPENKDAN